jgi:hypothetical protein
MIFCARMPLPVPAVDTGPAVRTGAIGVQTAAEPQPGGTILTARPGPGKQRGVPQADPQNDLAPPLARPRPVTSCSNPRRPTRDRPVAFLWVRPVTDQADPPDRVTTTPASRTVSNANHRLRGDRRLVAVKHNGLNR